MASALIGGILRSGLEPPAALIASDISSERLDDVARRFAIETTRENLEVAETSALVILAVKPQQFPDVAAGLRGRLKAEQTVLSIMAGVPIASIASALDGSLSIIRVMPNLPALVGAGISALTPGPGVTEDRMARAESIFRTVGETVRVPESLMDAVTAASGSGPGFVYAIIEAFIAACQSVGLDSQTSETLAKQTFYGATKLLVESGESASELRKRVSSPGGTTLAGLAALEKHALPETIKAAITAARDRSVELGKK